ncbi:MAG: serine/threonine protein kinase, partial [Acidobacteria bacterium]|nr:serine/threonine protein kinase [Acidobacteriota bacterium]
MSDRWQQIKELFDAASERRPEGRAAFLYAACGNDQALRSEVESLLAADEQAGSFMTGPVLGSASRSVFDPETRIAGRYRILRFLDQGGMGEVYEAEDLQLREPVALKVIRPVLALKADALERFRQEVQLARKVTHRNMCRIFDIGIQRSSDRGGCQTEKDITFLTMELLAGETLQAYLHRRGPLPLAEALPIIRQMAEGLRAAHQAGVLHLDFKSGNVILVPTGNQREPLRAVITDFGLARTHAAGTDGHPSSPAVEELMGTPNNMAPEQLESQRPTEAVDVYALGIVIYEMIAGRNPFKADVPQETLHNIRHKDPDPLAQYVSGVPAPWEALVKKMLAKDPAQRYATVAEVLAELYALAQGPAERKKAKAAAVSS